MAHLSIRDIERLENTSLASVMAAATVGGISEEVPCVLDTVDCAVASCVYDSGCHQDSGCEDNSECTNESCYAASCVQDSICEEASNCGIQSGGCEIGSICELGSWQTEPGEDAQGADPLLDSLRRALE